MQPLFDQNKKQVRCFVSQAGQAGGQQSGADFRVAYCLCPGGQPGEQTFLLRRYPAEQKGRQKTGFQPASAKLYSKVPQDTVAVKLSKW